MIPDCDPDHPGIGGAAAFPMFRDEDGIIVNAEPWNGFQAGTVAIDKERSYCVEQGDGSYLVHHEFRLLMPVPTDLDLTAEEAEELTRLVNDAVARSREALARGERMGRSPLEDGLHYLTSLQEARNARVGPVVPAGPDRADGPDGAKQGQH